jgi:hypothetical protein
MNTFEEKYGGYVAVFLMGLIVGTFGGYCLQFITGPHSESISREVCSARVEEVQCNAFGDCSLDGLRCNVTSLVDQVAFADAVAAQQKNMKELRTLHYVNEMNKQGEVKQE